MRYIVGLVYNPFTKQESDLDILTVCDKKDDAKEYIRRCVDYNEQAYRRSAAENGTSDIVKEYERVTTPEDEKNFGYSVVVGWRDKKRKKNNKWVWEYSIYERNLWTPETDDIYNKMSMPTKPKSEVNESK